MPVKKTWKKKGAKSAPKRKARFVKKRSASSKLLVAYKAPRKSEVKMIDTIAKELVFDNQLNIWEVCNAITEGSGVWNRIGRKIRMLSLEIEGHIEITGTNGSSLPRNDTVRIALIYDRQCNGSFPSSKADIFASFNYAGTPTTNVFSRISMNSTDRYIVLMDLQGQLPAMNVNGAGWTVATANSSLGQMVDLQSSKVINFKKWIPLKGLETVYKDTTTPPTIADIATGSLFLMTMSEAQNSVAGTVAYKLIYNTRLRYADN